MALSRPKDGFNSRRGRMHPKYQEAIRLRMEGKSYREIAKITGISKNSASRWCKNLKLPRSAQKILEGKTKYPKELFVKYNQLKAKKVRIANQKIEKNAAKEIQPLSKYELLLVGTALYWGEGYKTEKSHSICFVNSDPHMVALFLRFLREILQIPEEKLRASIRIHPNIIPKNAIKFWAQLTAIPKEQFRITRQVSKASNKKRPLNSLPYGTLDLRVHDKRKLSQIKGWIKGLRREIRLNQS